MALMHCPECDSHVSSSAKRCPSCGKKMRPVLRKVAKGSAIAVGTVGALVLLGTILGGGKR